MTDIGFVYVESSRCQTTVDSDVKSQVVVVHM